MTGLVIAGGLLLAAVAGAVTLATSSGPAARDGRTIRVTVPAGTAAQVAHGRRDRRIPRRIVARVGDTLRLVNHDAGPHMIGPFLVSAGQVLTTRLARPGVYRGRCTLVPDHRFELVVRA